MFKKLFITILLVLFMALPVMADGGYVAFKYGTVDVDVDDLNLMDILTVELDGSDKVSAPGIAAGYDSGDSRLEIEYFTRGTAKYGGTGYINGVLFGTADNILEIDTETFFVNMYWDFEVAKWLELYLGFGIGMATHSTELGDLGYTLSDSNADLAYNYQVGAAFIITDNFAIDVSGRYADLGDAEVGDVLPFDDVSVKSKEVIVALRYTF